MKRSLNRRGSAAVEFAFLAPILVLTLVAIVDLSNYFNIAFDTQRAAKDAAKVASIKLLQPGDPGSIIEQVAIDQAVLVLSVAAVPCDADDVTALWQLDADTGYYTVTVDVNCPYNPLILNLIGNSRSNFTMMTQQQGLVP